MPWKALYTGPPVRKAIQKFADAEDAKENGGMVALYPRTDDAMQMAVPNGEPPQDLHMTLVFLGDDVGGMSPDGLSRAVAQIADTYSIVTANVEGHGTLGEDAAVYLLSGSMDLSRIHEDALDAARSEIQLPEQHEPWLPHVTATYNASPDTLSFTGDVLFDRIGVAFSGTTQYFPLIGANVGPYSD